MRERRWNILVDLLQGRPHSIGAEIGVFEGDTSTYLMRSMPGLRLLYCIDPFEHYPAQTEILNLNKDKFYQVNYEKVINKFLSRMEPYLERYILLRMYSKTAARVVQDGSLDFVFIDGNHSYEFAKEDIELWLPKIKSGGLLTGHDYNVRGYKKSFGVTQAVEERFGTDFNFKRFMWWHEVK